MLGSSKRVPVLTNRPTTDICEKFSSEATRTPLRSVEISVFCCAVAAFKSTSGTPGNACVRGGVSGKSRFLLRGSVGVKRSTVCLSAPTGELSFSVDSDCQKKRRIGWVEGWRLDPVRKVDPRQRPLAQRRNITGDRLALGVWWKIEWSP